MAKGMTAADDEEVEKILNNKPDPEWQGFGGAGARPMIRMESYSSDSYANLLKSRIFKSIKRIFRARLFIDFENYRL